MRLVLAFIAGAVAVGTAWVLWAAVIHHGESDETKRNEAQVAQIVSDYFDATAPDTNWYVFSVEPYLGRWRVLLKNYNTGRAACALVKRAPISKSTNRLMPVGCQEAER